MTIYNWLSLFGIPSIIGMIIAYLVKRIKENDTKTVSVQLGVQSLLMDRLDYLHDKYMEEGWLNVHKKRLWENMYIQYSNLGADGVMAQAWKDIQALPTTPNQKGANHNEED